MTIDLAYTRNLSPEEKSALPADFARGLEIAARAEHPRETFVHERFEAQVERTPGAAALVWEDETLSYAELNARANRLAHHLRSLGVGPEARVGICAERGPEMVVAVLAVLKAGGAYVPLDPAYPEERLRYMLADSRPAALLIDAALRHLFADAALAVVELGALHPAWEDEPETNPERGALSPAHLAYVIYTSGSTGRPKGVRVPHGSLGATLAAAGEAFGLGAGDRVPSLASFAFDIWLFETLLPLLGGGTVRLVPRERVPDVPRLVEDLTGCTVLHAVPALMRRIVEEVRARPGGVLPALRHAFVGGDAVAPDLLEEMRGVFPAAGIHVLYGPTEATIICASHRLGSEAATRQMVGRPLGNAAIHVLDAAGQVAPKGAAGELCLGGASVARDYLGRPGLTAERFVPDPFAGEPGARLYRTGDRVRWVEVREYQSAKVRKSDDADDSREADSTLALSHSRTFALEFLGRTDHQVKVRGFRIEPGEIEARLAEHPGVRAPVVVAREDAPGDRRLVAYYLASEPVAVDALKSHLAERLPEYMVPAAYVWMETYPLTPNGKLDRSALPAPGGDAYAAREYEAPVGETEQAVAAIWAEVLGSERVGRRDHFFDLGGHSLLGTQVVSRIREVLGVEIPLRGLFEGPTVAELAGRVEEVRRAGAGAALPPLVPVDRAAPLPLSFAQERLWFLHQMAPEDTGYNGPWPSRLRGRLDASALERALGALTERHEALRTTFRPLEQGAVQVVHPAAPVRLPVVDLTGLAPEDREREARRLAREDAERPFDLEHGPLLRATLLRLADDEHVLLLAMHHIVSDDWSMGVLFRELLTLYEWFARPSGAARPASPLPPLAVQYADFAVWQRGWLQGEVLRQEIDWWRERLGGAPPALELPTDRPRPAVASSRGAAHAFRIPAEITRGLRALARREAASLYMVTHAAFDLLLSRWSGEEDMVVGSPIAGRTQVGTEGLIGFFVNTLALRIDLSGDPSFHELVRRVRETALGAYAHQELPFERLVEEVAPERGLSHTPLFQVMFALQNADTGVGSAIGGLRLEPFGGEVRAVRFDLELDLTEEGEELVGDLRFRTDLFDDAIMERFAAQYRALLAAAVASPEERLSRLAILPDQEARTLLAYGSGPAREDAGVPVHRLVAAQAARTPGALAVLFAGESLTYAELDARADRLARLLRGRAEPGTTIGICLNRGPEALVALLAVWKMGGVYLPLDPGHPVERLSFLLQDSGTKLVVSDLPLAGTLVAREADVLLLDPSAEGDLAGGELELGGGGPGDLAYLIYTSGSTGTPKAVMVEHAQLTHTLGASLETLGFAPGDVVAALASTSFDISLLELVTPLLAGGAVRIVPHEVVRDPETLVEAVGDVSVLHAVPALMRQVVEVVRGGGVLPSLRLLLVGGDSVPPDLLEDMRALFPAAQTRVLYGPTEATIICATYAVPAEGAVVGHPLGRPLPGVRLAVRGPRGELSPVGVPGEVWISGGGVARGYLGRPELNAEKFVGTGAERAYRTGDRARWRADGILEFLGRADEQVKVRGFRIEPGEVEAVLREQPGVREAVVLAREDAPGDRRLVAYVVPGADVVEATAGKEQVSEWETLFDDTYAQDEEEEDPALALKGWNSSYTGEPIPREEMRAWVEDTTERILALGPERVLEVGCGTGLLLFRVAQHTRAYHATDFSGVALDHVRRHSAGLPQVSLAEREADQLDEYAGAGFDLVVVNSVAQYFPDLGYLLRVLEGAAAALRPGGRIFVGDVRSLPLLGAFHASVELARAPEGLPAAQLQARVRRGMAEEQELLLDPALFEAVRARMPRLGRVEVQAKRGEYDNEVSRFRFDVVLHLDADITAAADSAVREWGGEDVAGLRALAEGNTSALLVRGVPDARVREHVRAYELVSAGGEATDAAAVRALAAEDAGGIAPEALFALGEAMGRTVEVRPAASGTLDVLFHPAAEVARFPAAVDAERPWESYANDPQWGRRMRALVPALREAARARLPEYMVPSAFVVLESFPVTPNGKVDRAALPAPDTPGSRGTYVAPRTPAEERMAGIWAEVLGVERVGGDDNFFDLGGHSLLATQLVSRVREAFRTELPLRAVFEAPMLAELAGRVEALRAETPGDAGAPPLVPVPRDGSPLPLSFAQQRQWFIDQMEGAGAAYHVAWRVRLRGELDRTALARALERIVERHESLRTTFPAVQGEPEQRIAPADQHGFTLRDHDLTGCADVEGELRRLAEEEFEAPFALAVGPLVRGRLVRVGPDDHALLLTMHHVVSDGWSIGVLARELKVLYTAFARGEADPLPPLPVQYADYAVWHRRWVSSPAVEAQARYWAETLAGAPELLELPTDRPRPTRQDFTGASVKVELDEALTAALRALSQRHGATPFMTLLAGWAVVLARLSGQSDVVVGTPTAGRGMREIEGLIGFFVNTLALRVELSGAPTVAELLRRVRERALEAQQYQDFPFEQVVERVRPARSLSYTPLFQVALAWQEMTGGELELPGIAAAPLDGVEEEAAAFDLMLSVAPSGGRITGDANYATALFDRVTVERWVGYLHRVLQAMVADDSAPVDRLELLSAAERRQVVEEWNATNAAFPAGACVHELVEAQVERTPGAVAVVFEGERVTYAELNARANRLAHHLRSLGVGPDGRVGICVERSVEMVVGLLGILKAGGAYVPLDASYPVDRLRFMLDDSAPAVLLTHPPQVATAAALSAGSAIPVLDLTADAAWAVHPATNPGPNGVGPKNLAHVLFTSGSTGRPKGVMLEHGSLVNRLAWMQDRYGMTPDEALLQKTPFSFDVSFWEFFWPLMLGARLVMARPDGHRDPAYLADIIEREGITHAHFVPSMLQLFLEHPDAAKCTGLLRVPVSGEAVSAALVRHFHERLPGVELTNQYGPTESGEVTEWACDPDAERVSIGRAIHNSTVYVLDRTGQPVPVGVAGELFIGGVAVARGYLGRPRLTAERFVPDPFGDPGARLYRTGDLCRWVEVRKCESTKVRKCESTKVRKSEGDDDSCEADSTLALSHSRTFALEYLGRTDFQVKVRGFRVEPGEVEARLAAHPGVREAVVLALDDGAGGKRLVAYFVGEALESEELRAHLSQQLPEYMVPAAFVRMEAFPVTPNGKLDRRALPAPNADAFAARAYEAPVGEAENALAGIWSELLGVERVGRGDHFFALGGHSLLAVRVVSRVRQALGVDASLGDLFERPVLADLARGLETATAEGTAIVPVERGGPLPLSFAQQRLWFIEQMEGAGPAYHLPLRLRLKGELYREALVRALDRIVARHEALRTSFPETDGVPAQRIAAVEESPFHLAEQDLAALPDAEDELRRLMLDEVGAPFDLARGPLVRGRLIRLAGDDHVLLVTMHHIVSDGWSMGIFIRELGALYAAFARGDADPLPPLPVQYADYTAWQRRRVDGDVLRRQADYWRDTLSGAPKLLELPTDRPRPARQDFAGASLNVELDEALVAGVAALSRRHRTTPFMTVLAGWAVVLSRLSGQDDVVVGTPAAGRGSGEVEGLIGFFVNTLALRVELFGAPTVAELLRRVRERVLEAQRNQDVPFEQVVERVRPARSLAHTPIFQAMLAWQEMPGGAPELPGLHVARLDAVEEEAAQFDLSLGLAPRGGRIAGEVIYATALFDRATVERYVGYLRRVLEEMAADGAKPVHRLDLLSAAERRRVVEEFNAGRAEPPREALVHERFEAQVERTPGAAALVWEDETLSYAELNARANRLAHHLRSLGVGPEARVGICVERGPEMVVGVLGVLKAGGAYVPLDPGHPAERLAYMLADSAPAAVLVQAHLRDRVESAGVPTVELDAAAPAWASLPATSPGRGGLTPDHLAYVIYTSGSTGRPKGVRVPHGSVGATLAVAGDAFGLGAGDRVPSLASFAFDIWLFETLLPLLGGGTVRLVPRDRVPDVPRLVEDLAGCTALHAVPALMRRIVEEVRARPGGVLPELRRVFVGGDAVAPDLLEEMRGVFPAAEVHVLYGPTEAAIICAAHRLGGEGAARQMVGRPLGNAALYVLEPGGDVALVGVAGELCLGGASVARDYLGRPGLTAERFVPDPFSARPGARLYRTGDRVRWVEVRECESAKVRKSSAGGDDSREADSTLALSHSRTFALEFLGRTDFQVKVRGFRIEPGEIEARLAEHAGVREAVVLVREDTPGEKRLVAYVAGDETATADVLRAHLSERLPEYMVPAAYVRLAALPLTPNGKVDRKALPAPEGDAFAARGYEAPSLTAEEAVAEIWAELLGAERVGRRDHFFERGGHSLLAVRVASRVRQALGVEVSPRDVFERPVLADFARGLETAAQAEATVIAPVDRTAAIPLSFAQQRLWFLEQLGNLGSTYHMPMGLRLRGDLDRGSLVWSLDRIVARHEALRTSFPAVDGEPVQRIAPVEESAFRLVEHDLHAAPDAEDELRRLMQGEASAPFDLEQGPLVRGRLVRMAADDHVLLLTMHHIVSDGWSMGVLYRELGALYAGFVLGRGDPLPPLPVQYADYTVWHRRWVEGPVLEAQGEYWTGTLAGAPELLELPTDHPRPAKQDFAGALVNVELDEALASALRTLSQRHGTTLFMTLLAGWATVLSRLSGQDDVVVGTPSANRGRSEIEGLIGFFVNMLPVRVDLSGAPTVVEALGRVKARALEAQANQDIPFEQVVELVQPARSLAHTPLFQVMFAWQNAPEESLALPGLALDPLDPLDPAGSGGSPPQVGAKFDLSLALWEDGGRIEGGVEYATALFERETVERYVGYLRRVLEGMAADDSTPVDRLELLSAAERRRVVEEWNATGAALPAGACVHELFEARVERTPGAAALVFEGETLSYAELNARANRLAHHLRSLGVGPEARVGICAEPGLEMVVGVLGVLKAGGGYVPLDPGYPAERLAYMLADSAPAVVLAQAHLRDRVTSANVPVVDLAAAAPAWASLPAANPGRGGLTPDHLAYVIYTSGSTGRPKGVRVPHGSVGATLAVAGDAFGLGAGDRVPSLASFAFDIWLFETLLPLLGGGTVRLVPRERVPDVPRLVEDLAGCTALHAVPALMRRIVEEVRARPGGVLPELRHAFVGGDAVAPDLLEEMRSVFPAAEIHVLYGPTEAAIICAAHRLGGDAAARQMVGRPLGNAALYVVEREGTVAPVGVAGELCLGGASVARDYLGRPGLTAERFVPDPFATAPGARLYRTGDRVRWVEVRESERANVRKPSAGGDDSREADSTLALSHSRTFALEFLGRTDHQVKVRGFRIEPGEIEARLLEHPEVREAVVLVREDAPGEKRLVAYVAGDETATVDVLRAHLADRLPEYMVPAAYVRLERLPLTPNGKVDRRALPPPEGGAFAARGYEAPSGRAEEAVAAIWAELLGAERVGRRDHFFELGGHSLLAVRVVSRVRQALGVEASPRDVFERPVLADFARALQTAAQAETMAITPVDRTAAIPLSFAQQRLWFLEQLGNLGSTYHLPMCLRLRGDLDRGALTRSLDRIVARHEALRTTFPTVDGEPVQHIAAVEESGFGLVEHDLRASANAEDELRQLIADEASAPFDLAQGPLFRGRLVRMTADDHVLLLTMHHIVSDGWSTGVLFRELAALYTAFTRGEPDPLPPLPVQYADYAVWHRRRVEGPVLEAQAEYWTQTLSGAPELLDLPTDHPRPAKQDFAGASASVELGEALTAALKTLSQRHGTTLFMTLLAGWASVLARLSGQGDVVIGTPSANRGHAEVEELIGFFVNTLPLRVDLSDGPRVGELLQRVRTHALEAQRNQDIPFEQVVERVRPARSLAYTPLFQVMFAWENAPGESLELPGLAVGHAGTAPGDTAKFDLSLTLWEDGGQIEGAVEYATALFERATVERHLVYLRRVLEAMVADDLQAVDALPLLPEAERRLVVEEWNRTDAEEPRDACVHALFEAQVARAPGAAAVVFDGGELTYAELNARANRLAHHLAGRGVGPDARVAICATRTAELVVGLLAILKAGGAYVPLDPAHPDERLRYLLADSAPALVLTQGALRERFAAARVPVVALDEDAPAWAREPEHDPARPELTPGHLAYVIYTSGSTGAPKGVMVAHRSVGRQVAAIQAGFSLRADDRSLQFASVTFDASVEEIFGALLSGAALVLRGEKWVEDARAFWDACARHRVTVIDLPTRFWQVLLDEPSAAVPECVRLLAIGGEAVEPAALEAWFLRGGHRPRLLNTYGPTETTVNATFHEVTGDPATWRSIGRPVANTRTYLLDARGRPVPVGVAGELYIGGGQVARGYLGRPGLTAERFVPDPFGGEPGARLYRTGDLGRWLADSGIEYLGRTDFQVKIRGFRIEPGEIEARLREHPAVRQAVVLARKDGPGEKRLVAYVVGDADAEALRAHLAASLPPYMVPAAYVRLEALPLTSSGKLDRGALPAPDAAAYARSGHEPPRTLTERVLAEIWTELLGVERVGRRDHFFDLGGHSLLAARLVSRVREALNPAATVEEVFVHPTLHELAARLAGGGEWFGTDHALPIRETGSERPLFVVHDAAGIVFYAQILRPHLDAEIPVYALPGPLNDTGELASLDDLVTRLVRMITEVQPEGPYRLAGWSAGGVFAYAVAERLVATGRAVEFVGLLDAPRPDGVPNEALVRSRQFTVLDLLARLNGVTPATPEALQALKEDTEGLELPAFIAECKARGLLPETVTMARAEQVDSRIALLRRTHEEFVPGPLPVSAHLFTSDDAVDDPRRGWDDIPGGAPFRLVRVPGTHHTMWKKGNVEVVGATISRAIRASAAGGG